MKLVMITGGLTGFLIGAAFGLAQGSPWPSIIWHSCIATAIAGMLMRWWGHVLVSSLHAAHAEKLAAAATAERSTPATGAPGTPKRS